MEIFTRVKLVEPSKNLAEGFILKAEHSLEEMNNSKYRESKIGHAYYAMYNSVYAILQRIGIKSEIHTCTFECMKTFLSDYFDTSECNFIAKALNARNDTTYYVNKDVSDELTDEMIKKAPEMVVKCKTILQKITENKIKTTREEIEKVE